MKDYKGKKNKREKFLVVDVETAGSLGKPLVYDIGVAVCDRYGNIYDSESFIIWDIFIEREDIMETAYYADKIPKYRSDITEGLHTTTPFMIARKHILKMMEMYKVKKVLAYNMAFDKRALNHTTDWISDGKHKYFFPYGTQFQCIWHMACQTVYQKKSFIKFALNHGFVSKANNIQTNAEVGFAYMTKNPYFKEDHTGLADVMIEVQLFAKCIATKMPMDRNIKAMCWKLPQNKRKELGL